MRQQISSLRCYGIAMIALGLLSALLLSACTNSQAGDITLTQPTEDSQGPPTTDLSMLDTQLVAGYDAVYEGVSQDDMIKNADMIVVGEIISISESVWNSDDGLYWEIEGDSALPLHHINISIKRSLAGNPDSILTITVLGNSPAGPAVVDADVIIGGHHEYDLQVGDRAVFFLRNTNLAWQGGTRPSLMLMGFPGHSYLKEKAGGKYHGGPDNLAIDLDALDRKIKEKRGNKP